MVQLTSSGGNTRPPAAAGQHHQVTPTSAAATAVPVPVALQESSHLHSQVDDSSPLASPTSTSTSKPISSRRPTSGPTVSSTTSTAKPSSLASAAAAATVHQASMKQNPGRPHLKVFPPGKLSTGSSTLSPTSRSPNSDAVSQPPSSESGTEEHVGVRSAEVSVAPIGTRRFWFRKKSGGSATSLIVAADELVDDVKTRILAKYPTSLQQHCDPADLVMTIAQTTGTRLELQPDENVVAVVDRFYPLGMKMNDAVEVGPPSATWASPMSFYVAGNGPHPLASNQAGLNTAPSVSSRTTPRTMLQRARSYSHSQSTLTQLNQSSQTNLHAGLQSPTVSSTALNQYGSDGVPPLPQGLSMNGGGTPTPSLSSGHSAASSKATTPTQERPQYGMTPPPPPPTQGTTSANPELSPPSQRPSRKSHSGTSVLLLPRQLGASSSKSHQTHENVRDTSEMMLVPITGKSGDSKRGVTHSDTHDYSKNWSDEKASTLSPAIPEEPSHMSASSLSQLQQKLTPSIEVAQGKSRIAPQINILIVEDNPVNQRILEGFLRHNKVRHESAKNGREALDKWKTGEYHLILMDIQLPVMTGLEATKEIRRLEILNGIGAFPQDSKEQQRTSPKSPHDVIKKSAGGFRSPVIIVALTASSDMDDKSEALAAGCNDFLTKPVNFVWLMKKIVEWGCMQALIDYDGWKKWSDVESASSAATKSIAGATGLGGPVSSSSTVRNTSSSAIPSQTPVA